MPDVKSARSTTWLAVPIFLVGASGCSSSSAESTRRAELSLEVLRPEITPRGLFQPFPRERLFPLIDEIDRSGVDVLCLQSVLDPVDRELVRENLTGSFPFSAELSTTDETEVSDPTGADGRVPEPAATPACTGTDAAMLDGYVACLQEACANDGYIQTWDCGLAACGPLFEAIPSETDARKRCGNCFASQIDFEASLPEMRERCTTMPGNPLGNRGDHGSMLLSKHPLDDLELAVFPSSRFRRVAIHARADTPAGPLHAFCASLGLVLPDLPYPGGYGDPSDGWQSEHALQLEKLLGFVRAKSGDEPAAVFVMTQASAGFESDEHVVIVNANEGTLVRLDSELLHAIPASFAPACTFCPENPLTPDVARLWMNHVYLSGLPATAVQSSSRTYLGNVVPVDPALINWKSVSSAMVPVTMEYGFRSTIVVER